MQERRRGSRLNISFPIRVKWKDENGQEVVQDGLTENVGPHGTLAFLPRQLPAVGSKVSLTLTERPDDEVTFSAQLLSSTLSKSGYKAERFCQAFQKWTGYFYHLHLFFPCLKTPLLP